MVLNQTEMDVKLVEVGFQLRVIGWSFLLLFYFPLLRSSVRCVDVEVVVVVVVVVVLRSLTEPRSFDVFESGCAERRSIILYYD